ncbi:hypothetical protein EDI_315810 [Entamoeba dispar SAW760]|uniref:Uncharacterized protein n=1 Tax=Entamoeba dispar (strain ATCC PRA-260 / SAW760) TaxID=370354 RepID=B0EAG4_ENTDS|nr:uncharacterized protein EDI_315810 [Entamoeba dispar SAW760]EDR28477.1 hypothetical protein EDI_315810 [Entamoeba dispar SAW760]|eukprot:EDR28477.1 hypothetical protein EDI_315810 [Entamoeba dispar SAW760]
MSTLLCFNLQPHVNKAKLKKERSIKIDKSMVSIYNEEELHLKAIEQSVKSSQINECRNREASFSNALAWLLIDRGYSLQLGITTIKESLKVIHFYVWDSIITPSGHEITIKEEENNLRELILKVQSKYSGLSSNVVTLANLQISLSAFRSPLSMFIPSNPKIFSILNSFRYPCQPFDS